MRTIVLILKVLGLLLTAAVSVVAGLQATGLWRPTKLHTIALVVAAALVALIGGLAQAFSAVRGARREELARIVRDGLLACFVEILASSRVSPRGLGFAAYQLKRRWAWPYKSHGRWYWDGFFPRVLVRLDRHRSANDSTAHRTVWCEGKGVIGACAQAGAKAEADVAQLWAGIPPNLDEAGWRSQPEQVRMGMNFEEFRRHRSDTGVVIAVPVVNRRGPHSKIIGCIALDAPAGSLPDLKRPAVHIDARLGDAVALFENAATRRG